MTPALIAAAAAADPFNGEYVAGNFVRLVIAIVGVTLALVAVKVGAVAALVKPRQPERSLGALAFACFVLTPSVSAILRFGNPLQVQTSVLYATGLVLGVAAVALQVRLVPPWDNWRQARARRSAHGSPTIPTIATETLMTDDEQTEQTPEPEQAETQPEQRRTEDKSWPPSGLERKTPGPMETK